MCEKFESRNNKMILEGTYIQYASGYVKDKITKDDIDKALGDLGVMDDEHGSFWVGVYGADSDEFVLEIHKSLKLFANFGDEDYKIQLGSIDESKPFFDLLINGLIDELKEKQRNN